jgi:hypothetical protein
VAWLKRELFRSGTQENCGSVWWKNVSRHAIVEWRKRNFTRKIRIRVNSESPQEFAAAGMRKSPEGNDGIRHQDVKVLPYLRKERKTTNGIKGWSAGQRSYLESGGTPSKIPYDIFGGKIAKQVVGTSRKVTKNKEMDLVESLTSSKTEKEIVHVVSTGKVGALASTDRERRKLRMIV